MSVCKYVSTPAKYHMSQVASPESQVATARPLRPPFIFMAVLAPCHQVPTYAYGKVATLQLQLLATTYKLHHNSLIVGVGCWLFITSSLFHYAHLE